MEGLNNINSTYIIEDTFKNFLSLKKRLNINKYNKILQKLVKVNLEDYIKNSKIEIEIIAKIGMYDKFANFINIPEDEQKYYHIIDSSFNQRDGTQKIRVIIDYYDIESMYGLFKECKCIEKK